MASKMGKRLPPVKSPPDKAWGERVSALRKAATPPAVVELTQGEFGRMVGAGARTVRRLEAGFGASPRILEGLRRITTELGGDADWLLTGNGKPPKRATDGPSSPSEPRSGPRLAPDSKRDGVKQRESALRAIASALQAEELHGTALVRALWRIAEEFEHLGHRHAANEIWREVAHLQGKSLEELHEQRRGP